MQISHSAMNTFLECNFKYFLHYFIKYRPKQLASPLVWGGAIDNALNVLLETKDVEKAKDAYRKHWLDLSKGNIKYSKSDVEEHLVHDIIEHGGSFEDQAMNSLMARGLIILDEYNIQIIPRIKEVIAVQVDDKLISDKQDALVIKADFICVWEDGRRVLFDNKTSSSKYAEDSVRTSAQLGIYYEALKEKYNLDAAGYIVIPKKVNKKKLPLVNIKVIIDSVDEETIDETLSNYDNTLEIIKEGIFEKNHKSCVTFFGKCPFYKYCHEGSIEGLDVK